MCCFVVVDLFIFFFKQKTAYEMRISDWSSDVCSSDLFCAGDVDAAMACVHPDAIWHVDGDPVVGTVGVIKGCDAVRARSEERRVGKECVSTCRSRWSPYH